jgi:DNA-binding MarR family transcriptional regulator
MKWLIVRMGSPFLTVDSEDRRSHRIMVTEKGRDVIERAYPAWKVAQTEVLRRLGAPGAAALKKTIRKLQV